MELREHTRMLELTQLTERRHCTDSAQKLAQSSAVARFERYLDRVVAASVTGGVCWCIETWSMMRRMAGSSSKGAGDDVIA
jgi:hypothetical protein